MRIDVRRVDWPFAQPFRTSQAVRTHARAIMVELGDGPLSGRGEGIPIDYRGETQESLVAQLGAVAEALEDGGSRADLDELLPAGAARNALDCAYWDLEAKRKGGRVWDLIGLGPVRPILSARTISLAAPSDMATAARQLEGFELLKLKLGGDGDVERVAAVRAARPKARLIVDANRSWSPDMLIPFSNALADLGVELIEQPFPVDEDFRLQGFEGPVPLCADESCQTPRSLAALIGRYQYINIKLDKTGGLSEALRLAAAARAQGLGLMVGCMAGSSLSMAPAFVIGQLCAFVDLDGPLLGARDLPHPIRYERGWMSAPDAKLWG